MENENYEPFDKIPAQESFMDRALEWSAMYQTLLNAGKLNKDDDISQLSNENLKEMIDIIQGEKEVEKLRKKYVIEDEDLENYNIIKPEDDE